MGTTVTPKVKTSRFTGSGKSNAAANEEGWTFTPLLKADLKGSKQIQSPGVATRDVTPKVVLSGLHDPGTGRLDARRIADYMAVPLKIFSEGVGLTYKTVHRSPSSAAIQKSLRPVKRSLELLDLFFGKPEVARAWLNTPHPDLDGTTALETILENKAGAVQALLENAWNGVPV